MQNYLDFLHALQSQLQYERHRGVVVLDGDMVWQSALVRQWLEHSSSQTRFALTSMALPVDKQVPANKGQQLLGRECHVLVVELGDSFDANSFNAACGTLVGGGILLLLTPEPTFLDCAQQWLKMHTDALLHLSQTLPVPILPSSQVAVPCPAMNGQDPFAEQNRAIEAIKKLVTGRRKRPLVLTADRGRGKSSALGIACARLLAEKPIQVLVTAPNPQSIAPVFAHAQRLLGEQVTLHKHRLLFEGGSLTFIAPDALLKDRPPCDLLLVDEAAAIPLPMLEAMVGHYHRCAFSSTIHGYEGCGRGFSVKFLRWLQQERPGAVHMHLHQPIRWAQSDPLEQWLNEAFLLNAELPPSPSVDISAPLLVRFDKSKLLLAPQWLEQCFALLVNAHYQTSPNDLWQLLSDQNVSLYALISETTCLGAMLTVEEGPIAPEMVSDILQGRRRPKGHFTPIMLLNHLHALEASSARCLRIMRIAVHPEYQGCGLGQTMLTQLHQMTHQGYDYLATCFGATEELVGFWLRCGFAPVRMGTGRDAASGTYSLLMLSANNSGCETWLSPLKDDFALQFLDLLPTIFSELEPRLVQRLLPRLAGELSQRQMGLIQQYTLGGSGYESVSTWLKPLVSSKTQSADRLLIRAVLQQHDAERLVTEFALQGRKALELHLRQSVATLLTAS